MTDERPPPDPAPVTIVGPVPIPVVVTGPVPVVRPQVQDQTTNPSIPARTTFEEDLTSASQRHVNLIWETTQQDVARWVIGASLAVAAILAVFGRLIGSTELQLAAVVFLFGVANLVTGFYFGRTNHTKTGGVGPGETGR